MGDEIRLPQPHEISDREKDDAMGAYLMMFAAWAVGLPLPTVNLLAAGIYHLVNARSTRFVAFHSLQSLLSQLPVTLLNVGLVGWTLGNLILEAGFKAPFFAYLAATVVVNLLYFVYSLVALTRARKGRMYYMPLFGRIAFARYFGPNAAEFAERPPANRPPSGS